MVCEVSDESRLMTEEVFGPLTCVVPFKTEEEVHCSEGRAMNLGKGL